MKSKTIYVTQIPTLKINIEDVDYELKQEFGVKYGETFEDRGDEFIITNEQALLRSMSHDSEIVNIDTLINSLETLRKKGSTHVAVDWHCDHLSYELYGYKVNLAEDNAIEEYQDRQKSINDKRKRISELQSQIHQINSEL